MRRLLAYAFPVALSLVATSAAFGILESTANMIAGFAQLFAPGATTVIFAPFLVLFILLGVTACVAAMCVASAGGAIIGKQWLRDPPSRPVSKPLFAVRAAVLHIALVLIIAHYNAGFLFSRPAQHPSPYLSAAIAAAGSVIAAYVAAAILAKRAES